MFLARPRAVLLVALSTLPLFPRLARGDQGAELAGTALTRNAEAVQEGRAALQAYERGDLQDAFSRFARAESLAHSPVFLLYMARIRERQGFWLESQQLYERVQQEPLSGSAPQAFRDAVAAARAEHAELSTRLPSIIVVLRNATASNTTVTLDGVPFDRFGREISLDPGPHVLVARTPDGLQTQREFVLAEGHKSVRVELTLSSEPRESAPPAAAASAPTRDERALPRSNYETAAYVTGGAGIAGMLLGVVAGTLAWSELQRIKDDCDGTRCDPADASRLDSVRRLGTIADVGFAIGAGGLGAAAVFLWVLPAQSRSTAPLTGVRLSATF